jgi:Rrf2 family nitric oxide-sensitive transcriptional repressor
MRLTQFSDYALRVVMMLGADRDRLVPVTEIAAAYRISYHHLTKVATLLVDLEVVEATRGRNGGLRLAKAPAEINVGWLVRATEPDMRMVECFDAATNTCPIAPECLLQNAIYKATQAYLAVLDGFTVADLIGSPSRHRRLIQLWRASAEVPIEALL